MDKIKDIMDLLDQWEDEQFPREYAEILASKLKHTHDALNRLYLSCPPPATSNFDTHAEMEEYISDITYAMEVLTNIEHGDEKAPLIEE